MRVAERDFPMALGRMLADVFLDILGLGGGAGEEEAGEGVGDGR